MPSRLQRVSQNEAIFRATNREIEGASEELGGGPQDELTVICECGEDGCSSTIDLTVAGYDEAHKQRDRFIVVPGHEDERIERVVTRAPNYLVVDKFGEAETIATAEEDRQQTD